MIDNNNAPHTIGDLISQGRGMDGVCRNCGREKRFSFASLTALPLPRADTLGKAGAKLKCRDSGCKQILLAPAELDPQAPLPAAAGAQP